MHKLALAAIAALAINNLPAVAQEATTTEPAAEQVGEMKLADDMVLRIKEIRRLEDKGVTDCIVGFRNAYQMEQDTETLEQKVAAMNWYAGEIIQRV